MNTKELIPFIAIHPGFVLKEELEARKISKKEFAVIIDMQSTLLNEIIKEKQAITNEIALSLEKALEIPADFWMSFQMRYDIDVVRIKERDIKKVQQNETWKLIKKHIHVSIFRKRGILTKSLEENIAKIFEIFEVTNVDELIESVSVLKDKELNKKSEYPKIDQTNIFAESKLEQWATKKEIKPYE